MYINLAVIFRFTFFPMSKVDGCIQPLVFDIATAFPFRVNLLPLLNLFDYDSKRDLLLNVIGNAAMFVPSGIVLPIVYKRLNTFWKVLLAGIGISLCIEIIQLPFNVRASDIDDLILNTIGVIAGYGIYALIRCVRRTKL
jgi:glycopeptide antibiotics resistance protein